MATQQTVEYSSKFRKVQSYYQMGNWSLEMVRNAVVKEWITEAEFQEITGESY